MCSEQSDQSQHSQSASHFWEGARLAGAHAAKTQRFPAEHCSVRGSLLFISLVSGFNVEGGPYILLLIVWWIAGGEKLLIVAVLKRLNKYHH